MRILLHKDGTPVKVGDEVISFRQEKYAVTGWAQNGRNRVYVKSLDPDRSNSYDEEYFVSVFDMKWEDAQ